MRRRQAGEERVSPSGNQSRASLLSSLLFSLFFFLSLSTSSYSAISPLQSVVMGKLGLAEPPQLPRPPLAVPQAVWKAYDEAVRGENEEDAIRMLYPEELLEKNAGLLLSFNLSLSAEKEMAQSAELHLRLRTNSTGGSLVRVYLVSDDIKVDRLVAASPVDPSTDWMAVDISEALSLVASSSHSKNHVLRLVVVLPAETWLVESTSLSSLGLSRAGSATLLIRYVEEDEERHGQRSKRSAERKERRKHRKNQHRLHGEKGLCQRREMYVDFEELKWNDWILAPKGYNAFLCSGRCPHPLPEALNASNHAVVQSLMHSLNPQIPSACCVPTEMSSLTILFMDASNSVQMRSYPDMVVEACGCR